jgi:hypothetical protein
MIGVGREWPRETRTLLRSQGNRGADGSEIEQREVDLELDAANASGSSFKFSWLNQYGVFSRDNSAASRSEDRVGNSSGQIHVRMVFLSEGRGATFKSTATASRGLNRAREIGKFKSEGCRAEGRGATLKSTAHAPG